MRALSLSVRADAPQTCTGTHSWAGRLLWLLSELSRPNIPKSSRLSGMVTRYPNGSLPVFFLMRKYKSIRGIESLAVLQSSAVTVT